MPFRLCFPFVLGLLIISQAFPALADDKIRKGKPSDAPRQNFDPVRFQGSRVAIDGFFLDWQDVPEVKADTLTSAQYEYDWSGEDDLTAWVQVQHNDTTLFVHVKVWDNALKAPTRKQGGDLVDIWFDLRRFHGKKNRFWQLSIDPSYILSEQAPDALWETPRKARDNDKSAIKTAGALLTDEKFNGYEIEVAIPFDQLGPEPPVVEPLGFCVVVRDWDQDDPLEDEASMATCPLDWRSRRHRKSKDMGVIEWNTTERIWDSVVAEYPDFEKNPPLRKKGQLGGDERTEEVIAGAGQIIVMGLGLGPGEWYAYDLGFYQESDEIVRLDVQDLDGDGDDEIAVVTRSRWNTGDAQIDQDVLRVFDWIDEGGGLAAGISDPLMRAEVALREVGGEFSAVADVRLSKHGVTLKADDVKGWSKDNWPFPEGGLDTKTAEMPLPWRKPRKHRWQRQGEDEGFERR